MSKIRVNQVETLDGLQTVDVSTIIDANTLITTSTGSQTLSGALDQRTIYIDTIADLKALNVSNLVDGQNIETREYNAGTGKGGSEYFWDANSTETEDGISVFTPDSAPVSGRFKKKDTIYVTAEEGGYHGATDRTQALQDTFDFVFGKGKGTLRMSGEYIIDRPITLTKGSHLDRVNVVVEGGGVIKKSGTFTGDRLVTLGFTGNSDEDCVVFSGITFDGVDKNINGVDWRGEVDAFDSNPTTIDSTNWTNYAKAIRFMYCNFVNCYRGSRVSGNSNSFIGCMYRNNVCGTFDTAAANDIRYISCSFRRGTVGAHIKTASSTLGTVSTKFESCIFESNTVVGLALEDRPNDVHVGGFYFENNGYDLTDTSYSNSMASPSKACHVHSFGNAWGSGLTTFDTGEFWPSPAGVIGLFGSRLERFTVINVSPVVEATNQIADTHFIGLTGPSNIDVSAAISSVVVTINGKRYYTSSTGLKEDAYDGENFSLGAGAGATVIKTETSDNGTFLIHTSTFTNSVAVFLAHRGTATVTEIAAAGSQTNKPSIAWNGNNLEATPGSSIGSRLNIVRVTRS